MHGSIRSTGGARAGGRGGANPAHLAHPRADAVRRCQPGVAHIRDEVLLHTCVPLGGRLDRSSGGGRMCQGAVCRASVALKDALCGRATVIRFLCRPYLPTCPRPVSRTRLTVVRPAPTRIAALATFPPSACSAHSINRRFSSRLR